MRDDVLMKHPAFIVLFGDDGKARMVSSLLTDEALGCRVLVPPVRGMDFFAEPAAQEELDRWWAHAMPREAHPVYLVEHHERLSDWIRGIDGSFLVEVDSPAAAALYDGLVSVSAVLCSSDMELAYEAERRFCHPATRPFLRTLDHAGMHDAAPAPALQRAPDDAGRADPFELLASMLSEEALPAVSESDRSAGSDPRLEGAPRERPERHPAAMWSRLRRPLVREAHRSRSQAVPDAELAQRIVQLGPILVAVGSRKGGVGKTSHAAGIAIVAGEALDAVGRRAAIVDANLANPDAWGQMNLPPGAATVRQTIAALTNDGDPPLPVHAATPALACYPEDRDGSEYSRTEIRRFAAFLRTRYSFTTVDLSNRLPDVAGGAEAAAAAFWVDEADVLLLPTGSSKQEFNGVLDYLDIRGLPPAVVAYIAPRSRRNRDHPLTKRYLEAITRRVHAVVQLPDDAEGVRYAVMEGLPVQSVSPGLRMAYRRLAEALASAARARVA